jgi:hypothetical protein
MAFGTATVLTNKGKAMYADRVRTTPATYTNPPKWLAIGTGATAAARTAAATDTALSTEVETRVAGAESVVTKTVTGDTYQVQGTINITAARAVDEAGQFDQLAVGGNMFVSATFAAINLGAGDSLQLTNQATIS